MTKIPPEERIYDISISLRSVQNFERVDIAIGVSTGNLEEAIFDIPKLIEDFRKELQNYDGKE